MLQVSQQLGRGRLRQVGGLRRMQDRTMPPQLHQQHQLAGLQVGADEAVRTGIGHS
jgi:hypothetical protein